MDVPSGSPAPLPGAALSPPRKRYDSDRHRHLSGRSVAERAIGAGFGPSCWPARFCFPLLGYRIARHGIRPVEEIAATARNITSTNLRERIRAEGYPSELASLAGTFNQMLDRLEESFERISRFSADIAHDLRTPVNNIRGEAEVALARARTVDEYRAVIESTLEEAVRLSELIGDLLFLARARESFDGVAPRARERRRVAERGSRLL